MVELKYQEGVSYMNKLDGYALPFLFKISPAGHRVLFETDSSEARYALRRAVNRWCIEQFGRSGRRWMTGQFEIGFRDEADACAFKLRWC